MVFPWGIRWPRVTLTKRIFYIIQGGVDRMVKVLKKYFLYAIIIAFVYLLLANHYIYTGGEDVNIMDSVRILKKEKLNLRYTFFSVQKKKPDYIMKIDVLRDAGIGDVLVEFGIINEDEKTALENKYLYEE